MAMKEIRNIMNNERGLGLLEVMVAMFIIAIGVLGLAPLIVLSIEENTVSRDYSTVSNLITEKIEYYQGLDSLPTAPFRLYEQGLSNIYSRTTRIDDNASDSLVPAGLCRVRVDVAWTDHQNVERSNTMSTYVIPD